MNNIINTITQSLSHFVSNIPAISPQTKKIALIVTAVASFLTVAYLGCRCQLRGKVKKAEDVEKKNVETEVKTPKEEKKLIL